MYVVNSLMERLCTLNMANLLTRSHLLQSQYKTPWIMSRGRSRSHFGITEKPTRDCVLGFLYNNVGLGVGNFEGKIWTSKISITPLSLGASYLHEVTPANIHTNLMLLKTRVIDLHYAADNLCLSSFKFFCWAPQDFFIFIYFYKRGVSAVQGHPRSINLVPIESAYATSY